MQWRIGTMGFSYPDWQRVFYPPNARPGEYLAIYSNTFDAVELDTTFHATPAIERVAKWAACVPQGFTFCVKTPRQVTHDAPIAFGASAMRYFLRSLRPMREAGKLGPVLLQFPPSFSVAELANLETFLKDLPKNQRYAVEFRHVSWETQATFDLLKRHRIAWVAGDYGTDPYPIHVTTDFLYLRFIGIHKQFKTHEQERIDMTDRLAWWHEHVTAASEQIITPTAPPPQAPVQPTPIYAFFNNDYAGFAPATAGRMAQQIGQPVRLPESSQPQQSLF